MRKTVHKLFWIWQFDKEEQWLNEMASKGLALISVGFCKYEFEDCIPGEYGIRLELLEKEVKHPESVKYIEFLEDTGAEHVGSILRWVYLRKKKSDGEFQLFSDIGSRIKHLTRIINLCLVAGILNLIIGINNILLYFSNRIPLSLIGILNVLVFAICLFGYLGLNKKRSKLKTEQQIFE